MIPSLHTALIWSSSVMTAGTGTIIYIGSDRLTSKIFLINSIFFIIWSLDVSLLPSSVTSDPYIENILLRLAYYMGIVISATSYYFSCSFPEDKNPPRTLLWSLIGIEILFIPLFIGPAIIRYSYKIVGEWGWGHTYGDLWFIFDLVVVSLWIKSVFILCGKYRSSNDRGTRSDIRCMMIILFLGFIPPSIFAILLPRLGYFDLIWLGPVSSCLWATLLAYFIVNKKRMDVKTALTEVLTVIMIVIFLIDIISDLMLGLIGQIATLTIFLIVTIALLKSVLRDERLRKAMGRRSIRINEKKDQLLAMIRHNLRGPLTNIRCGLETIMKDTGTTTGLNYPIMREAARSVTRIERMIMNMGIPENITRKLALQETAVDLKAIITDILEDLSPDIREKKILVILDHSPWPKLTVDRDSVHEIIFVILDNAVKYNKLGGQIEINGRMIGCRTKNNDSQKTSFEITTRNTGLGLSDSDCRKIFVLDNFRANDAMSANPSGMGIGLKLAHSMVRAHGGNISIASSGLGRGATVIVEIPINSNPASIDRAP